MPDRLASPASATCPAHRRGRRCRRLGPMCGMLRWARATAGGFEMSDARPTRDRVPRDRDNDYSADAARMRREFVRERTGVQLDHVGAFSLDPATLAREHRELHGCGAGPDGGGRPVVDRRRARTGRVLHPDGHDRGHVDRQLQPRHASAHRVWWGEDDGRRRSHAAGAGVHPRGRVAGPSLRGVGRRALRRRQSGGGDDDELGEADLDRPVLGRPAAVSPFQLHDG